jgi:hypothetical protein
MSTVTVLGNRRLPFTVNLDQALFEPQLRRTEAHQLVEDLERLLPREAIEEPDEGKLVGHAEPVMGRRHLPICAGSSSVRAAARLSWWRENIAGVTLRP